MINIPKDIHLGKGLLEKELPWFAPGAIIWLDEHLTKDMNVLEFGAGGSTPFFARRCLNVYSYETSKDWMNKVSNYLEEFGLDNVVFTDNEGEINTDTVEAWNSVVLIDSPIRSNKTSREKYLQMIIPTNPKLIIVDDFARLDIPEEIPGYYTIRFLDNRWKGKGVQIYVKEN